MEEKREDGEIVRVMTRQERLEYDDITIEDCSYEEGTGNGAGSKQAGSNRPETFNEAYEDNSHRSQAFRQNFRSYGGSRGPRVYTFGMGQGLTTWQKWKYRIIGALVAAAVIWFLIFVAFPIVAVGVIAAAIAYMLYNFFS